MEIKIKRSHETIKDKLLEAKVSHELLGKATKIANKLKRSDILLFWLNNSAKRSEREFDSALKYMPPFSKQELIDIIHELGPKTLQEFIKTFSKK